MNGGNAIRQVLIAVTRNSKARIDNHITEFLLLREPLNALNEVLVAIPIASNDLADQRNSAKRPALVQGIKDRVALHGAKLKTSEDTAGAENAVRLPQRGRDIRKVTNTKGDGVQIDRVIRDGSGQLGSVGDEEGECGLVGDGEGFGAGAANGQHGGVDVGDGQVYGGVVVDVDGVAEEAEGYVACAAGDVEEAEVGGGCCWHEACGEAGDELVSFEGGASLHGEHNCTVVSISLGGHELFAVS